MTVHPFPRRPLPDDLGVIANDMDGNPPRLMTSCEPPIHLFASGVPGAVCQCGEERWLADHARVVHTAEPGGVNVTLTFPTE